MFCVIYQWRVKPGKEEQFRQTWRDITEAIFEQHGSLGSRMHEGDDGTFVAYAQWPDREHWEHHADTVGVELARQRQAECIFEDVKVLHRLTVTDDLLQEAPFDQSSHSNRKTAEHLSVSNTAPKLRVARPTDRIDDVVRFYRDGLGLTELGHFQDHDGFDGVMLGQANLVYHFEFTSCRGHKAGVAPTKDNLLVFYLPDGDLWQAAVARMRQHGYEPVPSFNPYWDRHGRTFQDPDGYRVVLQNADWK